MVVGSRVQVWHGSADKTTGGLMKKDLFQDKYGRIRSRAVSRTSKKLNNLGIHKLPKGSRKFVLGGRPAAKAVGKKVSGRFRAKTFDPSIAKDKQVIAAFLARDIETLHNFIREDKEKTFKTLRKIGDGFIILGGDGALDVGHKIVQSGDAEMYRLLVDAGAYMSKHNTSLEMVEDESITPGHIEIARLMYSSPGWQEDLIRREGIHFHYSSQALSPKIFIIFMRNYPFWDGSIPASIRPANKEVLKQELDIRRSIETGKLSKPLGDILDAMLEKMPVGVAINTFLMGNNSFSPDYQKRFEALVSDYAHSKNDPIPRGFEDEPDCPICFDPIEDGDHVVCKECGHAIDSKCYSGLPVPKKCPHCRAINSYPAVDARGKVPRKRKRKASR
jgi:hypothetical protein